MVLRPGRRCRTCSTGRRSTVYRIDLRTKKATPVFRERTKARRRDRGGRRSCSRSAAADLLIIDDKNTVWRWRPADAKGNGTIRTVKVAGAPGWGDDVVAVGHVPARSRATGLYNLYIVDPSEQNILAYTPARDGSGFPVNPQNRLTVARDVSKVNDLVIDGDIFVADGGSLYRFVGGKSEGWETQPPGYSSDARDGDTLVREAPDYALIASASDKRTGVLYAWDKNNGRVVAYDKAKGTFIEQYRLAGGSPAWEDVRGMYVVLGSGPEAPIDPRLGDEGRRDVGRPGGGAGRRSGASGSPNPSHRRRPSRSRRPSRRRRRRNRPSVRDPAGADRRAVAGRRAAP